MAFNGERLNPFQFFGTVLLACILLSGCGSHTYHQVRPGDTLYSISWHYNQDYQKIAEWNGLKPPYLINEGQWLRVAPPAPKAGLEPPPYAKPKQASSPTKPKTQASKAPTIPRQQTPTETHAYSDVKRWQWPVRGKIIRKFSADKPGQQGIDISAKVGTLVNAAAAGKVVYSGNGLRGYGNLIIIKHNEELLSAYAHNQSLMVKEGALVKQGQPIGRVGNTESSQVKLHFQIRVNGKPVDPLRYLPK